jgi:hypothetical protein
MLHENGVSGPLVPATVGQLRIQAVLGMPSDSGYMVAKSPRSIFVILPMPQCSN